MLIQSTSAAGKSSLMDAVLDLMPEEERMQYSAMTGQSLFYLGETDLQHKILAIAEEEGVRQAAYALKLLQSRRRTDDCIDGQGRGDRQPGDEAVPRERPGHADVDDDRDRRRRGIIKPLSGADDQRRGASRRGRSTRGSGSADARRAAGGNRTARRSRRCTATRSGCSNPCTW